MSSTATLEEIAELRRLCTYSGDIAQQAITSFILQGSDNGAGKAL